MRINWKNRSKGLDASIFADIAFMLLFFFLVTTQMNEDKGIKTSLPPLNAISSNINIEQMDILLNAKDQIQINGQNVEADVLEEKLYDILSKKDPKTVSFVLKNDDGTSYQLYLEIYSALKQAYKLIRNDYTRTTFGVQFYDLSADLQKKIEKEIPIRIIESSL